MPQSTTIKNAKALSITADGNDICGTLASVDFTDERQTAEFYTACGDYALFLTGKRKVTGTLNIYFSETSGEGYLTLADAYDAETEITLVLSPTGGASGNQEWTGTILLSSLPMSFNPGDAGPIMVAVPFLAKGAFTRAAVV